MNNPLKLPILALFLLAISTTALADPAPAPANPPTPPKFLIGVWYQPISSFEKWKARGINTLVGYENEGGSVSRDQWMQAARNAGLFYIAKPTDDPDQMKADAADPYLLAWSQQDEPDGVGNTPPEKIIDIYKNWKSVSTAAGADKPVFLNFDGSKMQWRPAADYQQYILGADVLGFDFYPFNGGWGTNGIATIADRLDKLKAWTNGQKKIYVFIECSDQNLRVQDWTKQNDATGTPLSPKMRGPTADEMKTEVDTALQHGAAGIVYFPDKIGKGWEGFDGTTPDCEATMKQINTRLTDKAPKPDSKKSAPLDGKEITIDGVTYILKKKN